MNKRIAKSFIGIAALIIIAYVFYDFFSSVKEQKEATGDVPEVVVDESGETIKDEEGKEVQYGAHKGDMVYDYELIDIHTGEIVKMSDFRGKKVFLNFWASWCPPCRAEAPYLQEVHETRDDIVVLGVNVKDSEKTPNGEFEFVEEFGLTFQNVYAPKELYYVFPITSFPTSLFINSKGIIEEGVIGPVDTEVMLKRFETI